MRRIAHISDLHFGAEEPHVAEGLLADIARQHAHLLAVSGDLTQRARASQFRAARDFLARIDLPKIIVPGNHDIPLYNVLARFAWPLAGYCRYFDCEFFPTFDDGEIAVAGVNTARSNTWKDGRIGPGQIGRLQEYFAARDPQGLKLLVAHHPFIPPVRDPSAALVDGAPRALKMLEAVGCSLILAGHLHLAYVGDVRPHHVEIKRSILVAQAGTAISHRRRDEANAYNLLTVDGKRLTIEVRAWSGQEFAAVGASRYEHIDSGWNPMGAASGGQ